MHNHVSQDSQTPNHFRDAIGVVDERTGNRNWIYPKKPKGKLYTGRTWFSIALMALMFSGPFMKINGHPLLLLNILERKFIIFGIPFWPQDLPLFALLMLTFVVFIIVFTVVFGRVWCGWACPQTVFMEMLFRKIEYVFEGDAKEQKRINALKWSSSEKLRKRGTKNTIFFLLSFLIANTFLSYLIGVDEMKKLVTHGPAAHMGQFIALTIFSIVFYIVFAKMRELVCIVVCPYGRLQGLMLDKNSIVVAYDFIRGEPRGQHKRNESDHLGDCVDCHRCVHVCPTGIDIRNGTQLECVNCTACIDECDDVMERMHKPHGLIRYASQEEIAKGSVKRITFRSAAYMGVLACMICVLSYLLITRKDVEAVILRTPGMLFQNQTDHEVSNMYNFEVVNKTFAAQEVEIKVVSPAHITLKMVDREKSLLHLHEDDIIKGSFFLIMDKKYIQENNTPATLRVYSNGVLMDEIKTNFVGPVLH